MNEAMLKDLEVFMKDETKVRVTKKNGTHVIGKIVHLDKFAVHVRNVKEGFQDIVLAEDVKSIEAIQPVLAEL